MADLRPFRALRPVPDLAAEVAAPPYDVVDVEEARALAAGLPHCFLHVSRPEIDLPDDQPDGVPNPADGGRAVHARGRDALDALVRDGVLVLDAAATYLVYRQRMGSTEQTGVVGCAAVADYLDGTIATHEHTRPDKEDDRTRHVDTLDAHDEPVFLMAPRSAAVDAVVAAVMRAPAAVELTSKDGVEHTLWVVDGAQCQAQLRQAFADLPRLYVADGHHRSAAAARVHARRIAAGRGGEHDAFLAVVFPADELTVLPYNRVVADLAGLTPEEFLAAARVDFDVEPVAAAPAPPRHGFGMYVAGHWHLLRARRGAVEDADPIGRLDVSILQDGLLGPVLGVGDPRTDPRISFVGGIRGTAELERLVDSGRHAVAFGLHPTSAQEVMAVADAGRVMPPKSTWFEPKLASGLFVHPIGEISERRRAPARALHGTAR